MTTKVYLIYRKKNAHSSEEFSGEWAFLYNGILYMSLATFSIKVAIWGKKFPLFYMASFRTFRTTCHTFHTDLCRSRYTSIRQRNDKEIRI